MIEVSRTRLEAVAVVVHRDHDRFAYRHCQHEVCRELAAMLNTDPRVESPTFRSDA